MNDITIIPEEFVRSNKEHECILTSKQLSIIIPIFMNRTNKDICIFNIISICETLNLSYNSRNKSFIIDTLKLLKDKNKMTFRNKIYKDDKYKINNLKEIKANDIIYGEIINKLNINSCKINNTHIEKIIQYSQTNDIDIFTIIKLYSYVFNSLNVKYITLDDLCNRCNIKLKETIVKYNEIFKDLKLFDFIYVGYNKKYTNKYETIRTYYCDFYNKDSLNNIANNIEQGDLIEMSNTENETITEKGEYNIYYSNLDKLDKKGLYCLRNLNNNMLKIGIANNLSRRFKEIQNNFKFCGAIPDLKIECFIEYTNNYKLEQYLHKEFKELNYQNEWFSIENINLVLKKVEEFMK